MLERFTKSGRRAVESATAHAQRESAGQARPEHLLRAVLEEENSVAMQVLTGAGPTVQRLRETLEAQRGQYVDGLDADDAEALEVIGIDLDKVMRLIGGRLDKDTSARRPRFARSSRKALELALREAVAMRHGYIGTEHLLLGLVRVDDRVVNDTLQACGVDPDGLRAAVVEAVRRAG